MVEEESQESFLVTKKYVIIRTPNNDYEARAVLLNSYLALVQSVLDGIATVSRDYRNLTKDFLQTHIAAKINANGATVSK
jgi:hypothetical protein